MRQQIGMKNQPSSPMLSSSHVYATETNVDLIEHFLPMFDADEAFSRFQNQESILKAGDNNRSGHSYVNNGDEFVDSVSQRITPSETGHGQEKKRTMDSSSSSFKPPESKKTRGLECHVKNLSIIFEALSAT